MTDIRHEEYDGLCPDDRHEEFEKGVLQIVDLASGLRGTLQQLPSPSKIKRELKQLRGVLIKLSADAHSTLWGFDADGCQYSPTSDLLGRIDLAMHHVGTGRPKHDVSRRFLGIRAVELWRAHGGNIGAEGFVLFIEGLIETAGFGVEGKVRVHAITLVAELRKEHADSNPPRRDPFKLSRSPTRQ
jgi:hypothetical protein